MVLPIVFLFNAVVFAVVLEERFKFYVTGGAYLVSFVLSLVTDSIFSSMYADPIIHMTFSVAANMIIILIASVFVSSNNLLHKMTIAAIINYAFVYTLTLFSDIATQDLSWVFLLVYAVYLLIIMSIFSGPMRYFHSKGVDVSFFLLLIIAVFGSVLVNGYADALFEGLNTSAKNSLSLVPFIILVICTRLAYTVARSKARDTRNEDNLVLREVLADNFNSMYINRANLLAVKNAHPNLSLPNENLLKNFCVNQNINSVLATKIAIANDNKIRIDTNVSISDTPTGVLDICSVLSHLIDIAVTEQNHSEKQVVKLNVSQINNKHNFDIIFKTAKKEIGKVHDKTIDDFIKFTLDMLIDNVLFKKIKPVDKLKLELVKEIVSRKKGEMEIVNYEGYTQLKVTI